jgi:ATP-dependent Zn protease
MIAEYGMGTQIGSRRAPVEDYAISEHTRRIVDEEQQELTDLAWRRARSLIEQNRDSLEALARALLENEVLEREDIDRIMGSRVAARRSQGEVRVAASEPEVAG